MNNLLVPQNIKLLYNTFHNKKKERFDIILEPLQAITQLALLSFCPIGTKIAIQNNRIELQLPGYSQSFVRWYNNDNKEDLYYLFNACRRFTLFYGYLQNINDYNDYDENDEYIGEIMVNEYNDSNTILNNHDLYHLLIECAKEGFNRLSQTYGHIDKVSLLHTFQMYKVILDNPMFFDKDREKDNDIERNSNKQVEINKKLELENDNFSLYETNTKNKSNKIIKKNRKIDNRRNEYDEYNESNNNHNVHKSPKFNSQKNNINNTNNTNTLNKSPSLRSQSSQYQQNENNIDNIFINIRQLYSNNELYILFHTLKLLKNNDESDSVLYIEGLNYIMKNTYGKIKKWINDNIVF